MPKYDIRNGTLARRNRNSNFQRGSGVFKCESCGIQTRKSGDNCGHDGKLCNDCYELAGIYNHYLDNGTESVKKNYGAEIKERCGNILLKGGKLDSDNQELLDIAEGRSGVAVETTGDAEVVVAKQIAHAMLREAFIKYRQRDLPDSKEEALLNALDRFFEVNK